MQRFQNSTSSARVSALAGLCLLTFTYSPFCQAQTIVTSGVTGPVGIAATRDQLLVSDYTCTSVFSVDASGTATLFAKLPVPTGLIGVNNCETYLAISRGLGGFPSGAVYATQGPNIYQIPGTGSPDGSQVTLFSVLPGVSGYVNAHTDITFDNVGTFGNQMIVTTTNGGPSTVYTVSAEGAATPMSLSGKDTSGGLIGTEVEGPEVAPKTAGSYGGYVFVAAEDVGGIYAISPSGTVSPLIPVPGSPEAVRFVPAPGSDQCCNNDCDKCKCDKCNCNNNCNKNHWENSQHNQNPPWDNQKCDCDKCDCDHDCNTNHWQNSQHSQNPPWNQQKCDCDKCQKKACTFATTGFQYFQADLSASKVSGFSSSQLANFVGSALVPDENSNAIYAVSFPSLSVTLFATDSATAPFFHEGAAIVACCPRSQNHKKCDNNWDHCK